MYIHALAVHEGGGRDRRMINHFFTSGFPNNFRSSPLASWSFVFCVTLKFFPTSIDVEVEHGHRRLEWRAFPTRAAKGRAFERSGNLPRIRLGEDALLQVQRITALHDISRPFAAFLWTRYLGFLSHRNLHSYRLWPGRVINSSSSTGFLQSMKTPLMRRHRWP